MPDNTVNTLPASVPVAIIGAGPAGCALASLLRLRGLEVVLFDNGKRPSLLVGESLIPAAIPHLRALGLEEAVARVSVLKPGASLKHFGGAEIPFEFRDRGGRAPGYAYNVPRDKFDAILKERAIELGVRLVAHNATFDVAKAFDTPCQKVGPAASCGEQTTLAQTDPQSDIQLSASSLAAAGLQAPPQLLVDSSGRSRLFARLLNIPAERGKRNDVAYFAHYKNFRNLDSTPGQVVISILKSGWSWSIPLPGRTSVGVVLNRHAARQFGADPAERLQNVLARETLLASRSRHAKRLTPVMSYSNYQQMTTQGSGRGWVMVGDAYGFVDPMLSPGVFMALESASLFNQYTTVTQGRLLRHDAYRYTGELAQWHRAWQEIIDYFYDGRMINLVEAGHSITEECARLSPSRLANWHVRRVMGDLVSGVGTRSRYNRAVLNKSARFLVENTDDVARLAIQE